MGDWYGRPMATRSTRTLTLFVVLALLTGACGSDSTSSGGSDSDTSDVEVPAEADQATAAAVRYVDELGGEEAFAAVFLALDRGYDVSQVLGPDVTIAADGTIEGVEPEHEPFGATDVTAAQGGDGGEESMSAPQVELVALRTESAQDEDDTGRSDFDPTMAGIQGLELTLHEIWEGAGEEDFISGLDELLPARDEASDAESDSRDDISARDAQVLLGILLLSLRGYTPGQIAAGMATGSIVSESDSQICLDIDGEDPQKDKDRFAAFCAMVAQRNSQSDSEASGSGETDGQQSSESADTALEGIPTGLFEGTIDTSTGGFRTGVSIDSAQITLQYANGGVLVDWTVSWTEDAGECISTGTDSWSGSEVTLSQAQSFSIRGTRQFQPGDDSTCELGAEPASFDTVFRFEVDGSTVTSDIGVGIATIEVGG